MATGLFLCTNDTETHFESGMPTSEVSLDQDSLQLWLKLKALFIHFTLECCW
jgi:hypothetical protein